MILLLDHPVVAVEIEAAQGRRDNRIAEHAIVPDDPRHLECERKHEGGGDRETARAKGNTTALLAKEQPRHRYQKPQHGRRLRAVRPSITPAAAIPRPGRSAARISSRTSTDRQAANSGSDAIEYVVVMNISDR